MLFHRHKWTVLTTENKGSKINDMMAKGVYKFTDVPEWWSHSQLIITRKCDKCGTEEVVVKYV